MLLIISVLPFFGEEIIKINLVNLEKVEIYSRLSLVIFPCPKALK